MISKIKYYFRSIGQSIFAQIGISIYILADTFFISVYSGADGLAVLNLVIPFICLIYALGSMVGMGAATRTQIDQARGETCEDDFSQAVCWSLLLGLPFTLLGLLIPGQTLSFLGAGDLTLLGRGYMRVITMAAPLFMANYSFLAYVRNDNDPKTAMIATLAGSAFNLICDYLFMFVFDWGLTGAALATVCCPLITSACCSIHFFRKDNHVGLKVHRLRFSRLLQACRLGMPALMSELATCVSTAVYNALLLHLAGSTAVAAFGILCNLSCVIVAVFNGLAEGAQPMLSEKYGKGEKKTLRQLFYAAVGLILFLEAVVVLLSLVFTEPMISVFNQAGDMALQAYACRGIRLYFPGFLFAGLNTFFLTYLSSTDQALPSLIGSWLRGVILIVLSAIGLSLWLGIDGIWLSFDLTEAVSLGILIFLVHRAKRC